MSDTQNVFGTGGREMQRVVGFLTVLACVAFVFGCAPEEGEVEGNFTTVVQFRESIKASEVFSLLSEENLNPSVRVFTQYGEINSSWPIAEGTKNEQFDELMNRHVERLEFLLQNFDPDDFLEGRVYSELSNTLSRIEIDEDIDVVRIEVHGTIPESLENHSLVEYIDEREDVEEDREVNENVHSSDSSVGVQRQALDYDNDANHVPVAGTTTFWSDGILVKFWFDSLSASYYDSSNSWAYYNNNLAPAFEIDARFTSPIFQSLIAECGSDSSEEAGNLPLTYVDTEISDGQQWRICSVGTHNTSQLQTWYLYWTWRSLENLVTWDNPTMQIVLQPSERCSFCSDYFYNLWPAYCTCAVGDFDSPSSVYNNDNERWYQWIVEYDYYDHPGQEVGWIRN